MSSVSERAEELVSFCRAAMESCEPMDGFELLRMFRQHPEFDRMVVIAATGLDESEIEARGGVPKGTIVYRKPVQFEKLRGFIESALLRKELE